ncbi:hypothetical protein [Rhodoblastus acidophilus]|uniref:hypothetical protein n=1 Tax=Rhodoblastus acidophilus TaxID=1074 RepID=UPI000B506237|nr:hypothetical protein [Rhodoblastus acidophilus]PPQ35767.1 hypothetical protein CKO16_19780 [Rhodoblastus acidophilus]RAI19993.1 hypothetical protein CH337_10830 [Rhodoblastus acidophilus]
MSWRAIDVDDFVVQLSDDPVAGFKIGIVSESLDQRRGVTLDQGAFDFSPPPPVEYHLSVPLRIAARLHDFYELQISRMSA